MSELNIEQQEELLGLARQSIVQALAGGEDEPPRVSAALQAPGGAFVSLHDARGQLRGCIGNFVSQQPLYRTVGEMARAAAFNDPRFRPVQAEEMPGLNLEISVLSPLGKAAAEDIEVGKHGIFIISPRGRGVLLPQVASQYGWDRQTFLRQTCIKAGLPANAWQDDDVQIFVFTAQVFSEHS